MKINKAKNLIISVFKKHKLSRKHALICAKALVNAELVGAPSHGLARIISYCKRIIEPSEDEVQLHKTFLKNNLKKNFF